MTLSCDIALTLLDDHLDRRLAEADDTRLRRHLAGCQRCANELTQRRQLKQALQQWPVPEPDPDVLHHLLEHPGRRLSGQQPRPWAQSLKNGLMAASVLLLVAAGGYWSYLFSPANSEERPIHVLLDTDATELVRVAVDSRQEMEKVTMTVRLPPNVRIAGYPDDETFSWETELGAGSNLLTLPLHASAPGEGDLLMTVLPPSGEARTLRIRVLANNKVI